MCKIKHFYSYNSTTINIITFILVAFILLQINDEVGIALANYKHHRRLFEVSTTGKFMLVSLAALAVFNAFLNVAQDVARRQRIRYVYGFSVASSVHQNDCI